MSAASSKAASVRQRLLNRARAESDDFQALLTRYVLERFLYRLTPPSAATSTSRPVRADEPVYEEGRHCGIVYGMGTWD